MPPKELGSRPGLPRRAGLSRHHNRFLKDIFQGAATTVVTQRNKDPIHARYARLLDGGTKPTLAKLSLARMIAAISSSRGLPWPGNAAPPLVE